MSVVLRPCHLDAESARQHNWTGVLTSGKNLILMMQVSMLKRSAQDLFSCPAFMLHTFSDWHSPDSVDSPQDLPLTTRAAQQMLGLDLAKVTHTYNALLQVSFA